MTSIWIFVSSWMQNLFLQQKSLENMSNIVDFSKELNTTISFAISSGSIEKIWSWVVFKREKNYDYGGFSYIWTSLENLFFCGDTESEDTETNHIFIKNFIPYFENGESSLEETLTWRLINGSDTYISYRKEHKITKNGNKIVWKWVFWNKFSPWDYWTWVYLNSPTWMALDSEWKLYFSDTLNNRILYLSGSKLYPLLDFEDWLREPTGLYYNDSEKSLYIANSAKWEILKLSSKKINPTENLTFSGSFSPEVDISGIESMKFNFINNLKSAELNLPNSTWSFNFSSNISQNEDFLTGSTNILTYYFSDYNDLLSSTQIYDCISAWDFLQRIYIDTDSKVKKEIKECPSSWTWNLVTYWNSTPRNLLSSDNYQINIGNIQTNPSSEKWNLVVNVGFYDELWWKLYEKNFPFTTNWDDKIYTMDDNILEVYEKDLKYPNWIWWNWTSDFNEFDIYSFNNYNIDRKNDIILKTPIKDLDVSKNWDLWNFILKYYRNYNCYNLDENKEKIKTFLIKKNLR